MTDYIHSPRRSPRIPVRCSARISLHSGKFFASTTLDMSAGGCRVEVAGRAVVGERVFVALHDPTVFGSHLLSGTIAWCSDAPPWRCGIAFDRGSARAAAALFEQLRAARPELSRSGETVEAIPANALLTPTPTPGRGALVPAEAEILRAVGAGTELGALRDRLGTRWGVCVHSLFALLQRRVVEIGGPDRDVR
jgi:PilZ domain-containing protein